MISKEAREIAFKDNAGTNRLARVLTGRMKEEGKTPLLLDFGSINDNYSLTTNTFPVAIAKGDYTVCRLLLTEVPESLKRLAPGDRVLVAWVQNEAVVVDVIQSSNRL